jgi:hypothetical protein
MVNGVEGGAEGNSNSGFLRVSRMEDMVKDTEERFLWSDCGDKLIDVG